MRVLGAALLRAARASTHQTSFGGSRRSFVLIIRPRLTPAGGAGIDPRGNADLIFEPIAVGLDV